MAPLNKAGFVARYLSAHHLSEAELAPRLAVRCLRTLQREIPIAVDVAENSYGSPVIQLVREALRYLS